MREFSLSIAFEACCLRYEPGSTEPPPNRYSVPSIERVIRILYYLKRHKKAGVSQIANSLDITRSNCFAILKTLQANNFVLFDNDTKKYFLGPALLEFANSIAEDMSITHMARPYLEQFVKSTGLSILLVQRINDSRLLVIDRQDNTSDVRLTVSVGTRIPITHSATGRAFLAYMDEESIERLVRTVPVKQLTPHTITEPERILEDIRATRQRGYSVAYGENMPDVTAIAAPIFDAKNQPVYVVSTMGTVSAIPRDHVDVYGFALRQTADRISSALGNTSELVSAHRG